MERKKVRRASLLLGMVFLLPLRSQCGGSLDLPMGPVSSVTTASIAWSFRHICVVEMQFLMEAARGRKAWLGSWVQRLWLIPVGLA